jgi:hypothetical protein
MYRTVFIKAKVYILSDNQVGSYHFSLFFSRVERAFNLYLLPIILVGYVSASSSQLERKQRFLKLRRFFKRVVRWTLFGPEHDGAGFAFVFAKGLIWPLTSVTLCKKTGKEVVVSAQWASSIADRRPRLVSALWAYIDLQLRRFCCIYLSFVMLKNDDDNICCANASKWTVRGLVMSYSAKTPRAEQKRRTDGMIRALGFAFFCYEYVFLIIIWRYV